VGKSMSHLVGGAIFEAIRVLARPLTGVIEQGKPLAVTLGVVTGAGMGAGIAGILGWYVPIGGLIGVLAGALLWALVFPKQVSPASDAQTPVEFATAAPFRIPPQPGKVLQEWRHRSAVLTELTVACEHGLWSCGSLYQEEARVAEASISAGVWPEREEGETIPWPTIRAIELHRTDSSPETWIVYERGAEGIRKVTVEHADEEKAEAFLLAVQEILDCDWEKDEDEASGWESINFPVMLLGITFVFGAGVLALMFLWWSPYWAVGIWLALLLAEFQFAFVRMLSRPSFTVLRRQRVARYQPDAQAM
jgi:hypothetical protein